MPSSAAIASPVRGSLFAAAFPHLQAPAFSYCIPKLPNSLEACTCTQTTGGVARLGVRASVPRSSERDRRDSFGDPSSTLPSPRSSFCREQRLTYRRLYGQSQSALHRRSSARRVRIGGFDSSSLFLAVDATGQQSAQARTRLHKFRPSKPTDLLSRSGLLYGLLRPFVARLPSARALWGGDSRDRATPTHTPKTPSEASYGHRGLLAEAIFGRQARPRRSRRPSSLVSDGADAADSAAPDRQFPLGPPGRRNRPSSGLSSHRNWRN